jgi:hypothetical protein
LGALTSKENKAVDIDKESFVLWPFYLFYI